MSFTRDARKLEGLAVQMDQMNVVAGVTQMQAMPPSLAEVEDGLQIVHLTAHRKCASPPRLQSRPPFL
jgi:hypothetical protein